MIGPSSAPHFHPPPRRGVVSIPRVWLLASLLLAGCAINPPPNNGSALPPCPPPAVDPVYIWRGGDQVEITWPDMPVPVAGGAEQCLLQRRAILDLPEPVSIKRVESFIAFDRGDITEGVVAVYDQYGRAVYRRSPHKESGFAGLYEPYHSEAYSGPATKRVYVDIACRINAPSETTKELAGRCHFTATLTFGGDTPPPPPPPPPPPECEVPPGDAQHWGPPIDPSERPAQMIEALNSAKIVLGDRCGEPPTETLRLLGAILVDAGHCAAGPWGGAAGHGDAVAIRAPDGLYEEMHAVSFGNGCYTGRPYKAAWPWYGDQLGCTNPPLPTPPGNSIKLVCPGGDVTKRWCDATAIVHGCEFCADIGLPCMPGTGPGTGKDCVPRCDCPVRPEGHPQRYDCETAFYGGDPLWTCDGDLVVKPDNRARARCKEGTWIKVCTVNGMLCARVGP